MTGGLGKVLLVNVHLLVLLQPLFQRLLSIQARILAHADKPLFFAFGGHKKLVPEV